jgi:hypothetical protein
MRIENAMKEQSQLDVHEMMTIMHAPHRTTPSVAAANDDTGGKEVNHIYRYN